MAHSIRPTDELPDRCEQCDSPMTLERMEAPTGAAGDEPAEVPVCTNPECPNHSPGRTDPDVS